MATLKETVALTSQLNDLAAELHGEITNGDVDFEKLVDLADQISEHADSLAGAFARVNEALSEPLEHDGESNGGGAAGSAEESSGSSAGGGRSSTAGRRGSGKSARSGRGRRASGSSGSST